MYKDYNGIENFDAFLRYCDAPTKVHLLQFKDEKGLAEYRQLRIDLEHRLGVLDLIIEKEVDIVAVKNASSLEEYNNKMNGFIQLTQYEFDAIRGVLNNA